MLVCLNPLPILKIEPLEEIQNEEDEDPYRDLITDKRTGKQYWISTGDGLMNYLTENVCDTITMPLLPESQSWKEVEATLRFWQLRLKKRVKFKF